MDQIENVKELIDISAAICSTTVDNVLYRIFVYPDVRKENWCEYFIIHDGMFLWEATKISRISFREPKYIHTDINEYKENWTLNGSEKKILMDMLNEIRWTEDETGFVHKNWHNAIIGFNNERVWYGDLDYDEVITEENLLSSGNLKYPELLPYDLPMPNYLELPD